MAQIVGMIRIKLTDEANLLRGGRSYRARVVAIGMGCFLFEMFFLHEALGLGRNLPRRPFLCHGNVVRRVGSLVQ